MQDTRSFQDRLPTVEKCCGCVTDLKTASAIIAVLGIVTSPAVSWAAVRHSFVIRVSCFVTTSNIRADVLDVNLNNILSFGFGANAGLGPSCLGPKNLTRLMAFRSPELDGVKYSGYVMTVRWVGWVVLTADVIFLLCSINFLYKIFRPPDDKAAVRFMISCILAIILSFIYGMLYVGACVSVGGAFPIFEFMFCIIDVLTYLFWIYYIQYVWLYIKKQREPPPSPPLSRFQEFLESLKPYSPDNMWADYQKKKQRPTMDDLLRDVTVRHDII